MKKIIALLASLMLILSLAVTAFAAETILTVETVNGTFKAGDEVTVTKGDDGLKFLSAEVIKN